MWPYRWESGNLPESKIIKPRLGFTYLSLTPHWSITLWMDEEKIKHNTKDAVLCNWIRPDDSGKLGSPKVGESKLQMTKPHHDPRLN